MQKKSNVVEEEQLKKRQKKEILNQKVKRNGEGKMKKKDTYL